jgi:hypothetical protein
MTNSDEIDNTVYNTLADAYKANESVYDVALKDAVYSDASDVSTEVFIKAVQNMLDNRRYSDKLMQSSKQSLLSLVKTEINKESRILLYRKMLSKEYYEKSDKNIPDTTEKYFYRLNAIRNMVRAKQKRIKQLACIAKELKASMK